MPALPLDATSDALSLDGQLAARARQQAAVATLGLRALGDPDVPSLLEHAVAAVSETLGTELVKVLELLPDGGAVRLVAGTGWRAGLVGQATVGIGSESQAGYTLRADEPVLVADLRTETRFTGPALLHDHGVVSGLSVVIAGSAGRPYGVLGAHTIHRRDFTRDDAHFVQAVANVLAAALDRRRGEDALRSARAEADAYVMQLQEQAADLEGQAAEAAALSAELAATNAQLEGAVGRAGHLLAVSAGLSAAATPADVADVIFREGLAALGTDAGALALVHDPCDAHDVHDALGGPVTAVRDATATGAELEIVRTIGYPEPLASRYRRFPLTPGRPISDAVLTRTPRLLGSWAEWLAAYPDADADIGATGYEAFVAFPVLVGGRVLAVFSASFHHPVTFTDETRTFLATLGEQCGLALARAQAADAERRARDASAFLSEASRLLAASLEYATTLRTVAEAAVPRLGDWCAVDMVRDPTAPTWPPELDRVAVVHQDPAKLALGAALTERYPTDWASDGGMAAVLRDGTPLFVPAITDAMLVAGARDSEHLALLRALEFSSILVVPLVARGRTLGALTLCHTESGRRYVAADLTLAQDLAQRAALAVDNARLYRDAERAREVAEEARQAAEAASRAKGEFLAVMSHELRTPLNAIGGHVQLLDMGLHGPVTDAQRAALGRVDRAQHHLLGLINDILNFARIESGRVEYDLRPVRVDEVVAEVRAMVEPQLAAKGLAFDVRPPGTAAAETNGAAATDAATNTDARSVRADREKLAQILLNLLSNAVKFTPAGGRVAVEFAIGADGATTALACVRVTDTGVGIPPDKLEAVFEPFVQVRGTGQGTYAPGPGGTGLGLAISRDLARGMGGDLTVESTPGVGSTFTVTLPRA